MADDATPPQDEQAAEQEQPQPEAAADEATEAAAAPVEDAAPEAEPEAPAEEPQAAAPEEPQAAPAEEPQAAAPEEPQAAPAEEPQAAAEEPQAAAEATDTEDQDEAPAAPREKPAIPGMDLEVDIVPEGMDPLARAEAEEEAAAAAAAEAEEEADQQPVAATIDLAATARYRATGKRKTAIARVTLKPGTGAYTINGKTLDEFFPRPTLQRNIRQPLEAVGYDDRMDVVATMTGGGVSAQAGALRHGVSRALLEADPNLRGELKRRGFLTRDSRAKERKKAGLKKARKRPQFSKR
jgi:small subunit ribosomal protein S9